MEPDIAHNFFPTLTPCQWWGSPYFIFAFQLIFYVFSFFPPVLFFISVSRDCLAGTIQHASNVAVKCPFKDDKYSCDMALLDREIRAVSNCLCWDDA